MDDLHVISWWLGPDLTTGQLKFALASSAYSHDSLIPRELYWRTLPGAGPAGIFQVSEFAAFSYIFHQLETNGLFAYY